MYIHSFGTCFVALPSFLRAYTEVWDRCCSVEILPPLSLFTFVATNFFNPQPTPTGCTRIIDSNRIYIHPTYGCPSFLSDLTSYCLPEATRRKRTGGSSTIQICRLRSSATIYLPTQNTDSTGSQFIHRCLHLADMAAARPKDHTGTHTGTHPTESLLIGTRPIETHPLVDQDMT